MDVTTKRTATENNNAYGSKKRTASCKKRAYGSISENCGSKQEVSRTMIIKRTLEAQGEEGFG